MIRRARMHILIFNWKDTSHPLSGGAEVFTEEVARSLVQRGHAVTLFASYVADRPERETFAGVDLVRRGGRMGVYREARRFWKEQPQKRFDVVIDEVNTRPFMTPRWIRDTPVVALIHQLAREIWFYETPFPVSVVGRYVLEPWWLRAYRRVPAMTVSESSAESLMRHHGWRDITVLPEGFTPHATPNGTKESRPTVVFLGRLVGMKRPDHAISAFQVLVQEFPEAQLWMIGDGSQLPLLRKKAPPRVQFLGRIGREELDFRLARAHVLITTSVREGWGLNVSEAATCGTPSIGYEVPGLVDSIRASGGALVEPTPDALGDSLVRFFRGELPLVPCVSTRPWPEVAANVERRLTEVIAAFRPGAGRALGPEA